MFLGLFLMVLTNKYLEHLLTMSYNSSIDLAILRITTLVFFYKYF
jgi:hypothetical protein